MKQISFPRMHVSLNVSSVKKTMDFYNVLFGQEPSKVKEDYIKYELSSPSLIISFIQKKENIHPYFGHLGFQVANPEELENRFQQIKQHGLQTLEEKGTSCCYAKQDKFWVADPDGYRWEIYYFHNDVAFNEPFYQEQTTTNEQLEKHGLGKACC